MISSEKWKTVTVEGGETTAGFIHSHFLTVAKLQKTTSNQRDTFFLFLFNDPADFFLSFLLSSFFPVARGFFVCACRSNSSAKKGKEKEQTHTHTHTPDFDLEQKKKNLRNENRARSDNCPEVTHADAEHACKHVREAFTRKLILMLILFFFFFFPFRSVKNKQKKNFRNIRIGFICAHFRGSPGRAISFRGTKCMTWINKLQKKKNPPPEISNPLGPRWSTYYFKMELH